MKTEERNKSRSCNGVSHVTPCDTTPPASSAPWPPAWLRSETAVPVDWNVVRWGPALDDDTPPIVIPIKRIQSEAS